MNHRDTQRMFNNEKHEIHEENVGEILYRQESYKIIGACFEVYKNMGSGFLESVYQECLRKEFGLQKISFIEKPKLQIKYKGEILEQGYEPDFLCYEKIVLEIKAVKKLADEHRAQVINYLKGAELRLGLLVNFGHYPKIEHERLIR
ncbi:MAG TPA: GxxExxY protein [Thermodesulfovibrionales bacterium]|nr:GxxExxY protein [Thermodesulfovibrionales bacterium]